MVYVWIEWHLKGTGVWTASLLSVFVNLVLVFIHLRKPKRICTKAGLYTILIALCGLAVIVINQAQFIIESVNPRKHSAILIAIRKFTLTRACDFLRQFFPTILDLLVFSDCINRFILICYPQQKLLVLSRKCVLISMSCILGISSLFAALAAGAEHEIEMFNDFLLDFLFDHGALAKKALLYLIVLKGTISIAIWGFFIVMTTKICRVLTKGVQFLLESKAGPEGIAKYSKIMRYSYVICLIVVFFNLILENIDLGLLAWIKLFSLNFIPVTDLRNVHKATEGRLLIRLMLSLKPGFYGLAYIWVKLS